MLRAIGTVVNGNVRSGRSERQRVVILILHVGLGWVGWLKWPAEHGTNERETSPILPSGLSIMTYRLNLCGIHDLVKAGPPGVSLPV